MILIDGVDVDVLVPSGVVPVVGIPVRRDVTEMLAPVGRGTSSVSPSMTVQ